jgi:hypothetical protein
VDDAPPGVTALEPQRQLSVGIEVELDAALAQVPHHRRRLGDEGLDSGGATEAAPGGERVGGVLRGRVARLQRGGEAALRPIAGALSERGAGDEADPAALLRRPQSRPEAGGAAADDDDVELGCGLYRFPASRRIAST